jgi:hypothetical protein
MTVEYTHNGYCEICLHAMVELVPLRGDTCCVMLVDVIQTLMCSMTVQLFRERDTVAPEARVI